MGKFFAGVVLGALLVSAPTARAYWPQGAASMVGGWLRRIAVAQESSARAEWVQVWHLSQRCGAAPASKGGNAPKETDR